MKKKVCCIVGTRPEAIKMAPVILEMRSRPLEFELRIVATAQHREMLDSVFEIFEISPDIDLNLMKRNQSLVQVCCRVMEAIGNICSVEPPDVVLAQGDTTSAMASSMACFLREIPFGHIEAGLRTGDMKSPFPEEFNRRVAGLASRFHFAPTPWSRDNLLEEKVDPESIFVVGNPIVDALHHVLSRQLLSDPVYPWMREKPYILMTCHRRESFGEKMEGIFEMVRCFAMDHSEMNVCYPIHPNPNVKGPAHRILGGVDNVYHLEPMDYVTFLYALKGCYMILSDSGGVQEEAATLGKPCLVMRDMTERPEGVEAGVCELVGTDPRRILGSLEQVLGDTDKYEAMTRGRNVYGNGHAAEAIANVLAADH